MQIISAGWSITFSFWLQIAFVPVGTGAQPCCCRHHSVRMNNQRRSSSLTPTKFVFHGEAFIEECKTHICWSISLRAGIFIAFFWMGWPNWHADLFSICYDSGGRNAHWATESRNRNVGGRGSLNHSSLLLEADLSPALNHVNNGFVYPKLLKCPWMEAPQPPGLTFLAFLHPSSGKNSLFHQKKLSKMQFVASTFSVTAENSLDLSSL